MNTEVLVLADRAESKCIDRFREIDRVAQENTEILVLLVQPDMDMMTLDERL